ncbi:MAG: response regulator [Bacteriovoracaceae bacterium]
MTQTIERPIRILCCDDDSSIREFLRAVIASVVVAEITTCEDGLEGMKLVSENQYDIVISDFNMNIKNGSGIDLYNYIKDHNIKVPFLLFTSDFYLDFDHYSSEENFKYIDKLRFEDLLTQVKAICARQFNSEL